MNPPAPDDRLPLVMRWDGNRWNDLEAVELLPHPQQKDAFPRSAGISDMLAIGDDDAWMVGSGEGFGAGGGGEFGAFTIGTTIHYDGSSWEEVLAPEVANYRHELYGVDGVASDDVWAVSAWPGGFHHWDGLAWSFLGSPQVPGAATVYRGRSLVAVGPCDVWSTGSYRTPAEENFTLTERLRPDDGAAQLELNAASGTMTA